MVEQTIVKRIFNKMDKKRKQIIEGFPEADAQKIIKRIQEQNRRLRIHRQKKVTPDKPYYSSKKLGSRFESRLPSALVEEDFEKHSPFGKYSPKAGLSKGVNEVIDLFSNEEEKRGSRLAKKAAKAIREQEYASGGLVSRQVSGFGKARKK